jgi:hypothetical protein
LWFQYVDYIDWCHLIWYIGYGYRVRADNATGDCI